ncbi:hypothetical protein AQY21_02245 [Paracoccus sp. MKU1]|nr:hypothetical protein AQY21_02245 [Paracoccus sp. MKU1]
MGEALLPCGNVLDPATIKPVIRFDFVTSFDEVAAVLFIAGPDQQTIPGQMWKGIYEQISPSPRCW